MTLARSIWLGTALAMFMQGPVRSSPEVSDAEKAHRECVEFVKKLDESSRKRIRSMGKKLLLKLEVELIPGGHGVFVEAAIDGFDLNEDRTLDSSELNRLLEKCKIGNCLTRGSYTKGVLKTFDEDVSSSLGPWELAKIYILLGYTVNSEVNWLISEETETEVEDEATSAALEVKAESTPAPGAGTPSPTGQTQTPPKESSKSSDRSE